MEDELLTDFVQEARDHLGSIESQLLKIEILGDEFDDCLVNTVFRAIHSIKGAAGFLGLVTINRLSPSLENVLGAVRAHKLIPDPFNVDVMLRAADRLRDMIENVQSSNEENVDQLVVRLDEIFDTTLRPQASASSKASQPSKAVKAKVATAAKGSTGSPAGEGGAVKVAAKPRRTSKKQSSNSESTAGPGSEGLSAGAVDATSDVPTDASSGILVAESAIERIGETQSRLAQVESGLAGEPSGSDAGESSLGGSGRSADGFPADGSAKKASQPEATIRVGVRVLDRLMNLAGELVLSRNQLLRAIDDRGQDGSTLSPIAAELDQVTTELQEAIMQTRMQPIGNVFNKFPRVLRDLSAQLGKQVSLEMEGNEVEVDKTIVEAIADPLTHLIRNSVDHGVESPEIRVAAGKPAEGLVKLKAFHQAGKVVIEIIDDGAGMDAAKLRAKAIEKGVITADAAARMSTRDSLGLIFAPGFSTAAKITSVSGRGVGMDVVKTNIEKLGGSVEIESTPGKGSTIRILVPLTLAIVPSMIIASYGYRFALPHACIIELVRADGNEKRIERVSGVEVLRIRGKLLPLVRLSELLGMRASGNQRSDDDPCQEDQIVVVEANEIRFALAVDQVLDSEEIVVKPLGRHLNNLPLLAGATILGDGKVAMILDAVGIAARARLAVGVDELEAAQGVIEMLGTKESQRMLLLSLNDVDHFAVSMDIVNRIERVSTREIEFVGDQKVLKYGGVMLPLLEIQHVLRCAEPVEVDQVYAVVFTVYGREVGLLAPWLRDIRECTSKIDTGNCEEKSVAGVAVIDDRVTRVLDVYSLTEALHPTWFDKYRELRPEVERNRVVVCEDSAFFRSFLNTTLKDHGYEVFDAADGELGWELLCETPDIHLIVTDVEMPNLGGFDLTERVRKEPRFAHLPVIALTSLSDEESIRRGLAAGVDDYQVKMNKPVLLESVAKLIGTHSKFQYLHTSELASR
jgi:two-component system chemotaxis sensor kinase CheA